MRVGVGVGVGVVGVEVLEVKGAVGVRCDGLAHALPLLGARAAANVDDDDAADEAREEGLDAELEGGHLVALESGGELLVRGRGRGRVRGRGGELGLELGLGLG